MGNSKVGTGMWNGCDDGGSDLVSVNGVNSQVATDI